MSTKSSVIWIIESLQKMVDNLEDKEWCPSMLLRDFDYSLIVHANVSIRKAAILTLFLVLRASMEKGLKIQDNQPVYAPLQVNDGILHLAARSGDNGLVSFHSSLKRIAKSQPNFLDRYLLAYSLESGEDGLVHGVEIFKSGSRVIIMNCLDSLPDPAVSKIFCKAEEKWKANLGLVYLRVGGGEEDIPTSSSRSSSSDSCRSLGDLARGDNTLQDRVVPKRKYTLDVGYSNHQSQISKNKKYFTTGHLQKVQEEGRLLKMLDELKPIQHTIFTEEKREQGKFIIKKRCSSLSKGKPLRLVSPSKRRTDKITITSVSTKEQSLGSICGSYSALEKRKARIATPSKSRAEKLVKVTPQDGKLLPLNPTLDSTTTALKRQPRGFFFKRTKI